MFYSVICIRTGLFVKLVEITYMYKNESQIFKKKMKIFYLIIVQRISRSKDYIFLKHLLFTECTHLFMMETKQMLIQAQKSGSRWLML